MSKPKKNVIEVQGTAITVIAKEQGDYISLTDMVRNFEGGGALIEQWLKNKDTVLFLGVWEQINNPDFNSLEFEGIRNFNWRHLWDQLNNPSFNPVEFDGIRLSNRRPRALLKP